MSILSEKRGIRGRGTIFVPQTLDRKQLFASRGSKLEHSRSPEVAVPIESPKGV
jgi:hypothetical protein